MRRVWRQTLTLILSAMVALSGALAAAVDQLEEIRLADSTGDWGFPNPYRHYPRGPGYVRMSWVFDTLVWKGEKGHQPALAESWTYDAEKKAFVFKLNPKAVWHDGKAVTAQDVAFTVDYFKKHPYGWVVLDNVDRAEALDTKTARIYLKKPYSPFLADIGGTMPILPKHIWERVDKPQTFDAPEAYLGSGPYRFKDFNKAKGTYLYEAFPAYYQGEPKAKRLIYIKSTEPLMALTTGQADLASIQPEMVPLLKEKGFVIIKDKHGWNKKLMINHKVPPFNDRRFRQALAHAIDQKEIIEKAHRGLGAPASYGLLSDDHEMYNPNTRCYPPDTAKAREIIESLGYQKGPDGLYRKDGKPLKVELLASNITVAGQSVSDRDGEVIKQQLERAGIRVELLNLEQASTDGKIKNWDFQLAVSGHGGILGDAKILNEMISSEYGAGSVNSARFDQNQELNTLLAAQLAEMNPDKRRDLVKRIQELYAEELPAIPLYYPDTISAYNPKKGVIWFYTPGGISKGIPIPQNKMSLIK
ncbi:MAG: ABC transporter substrate-binding protein [Desulfobaccales bacterium]